MDRDAHSQAHCARTQLTTAHTNHEENRPASAHVSPPAGRAGAVLRSLYRVCVPQCCWNACAVTVRWQRLQTSKEGDIRDATESAHSAQRTAQGASRRHRATEHRPCQRLPLRQRACLLMSLAIRRTRRNGALIGHARVPCRHAALVQLVPTATAAAFRRRRIVRAPCECVQQCPRVCFVVSCVCVPAWHRVTAHEPGGSAEPTESKGKGKKNQRTPRRTHTPKKKTRLGTA
jgi:hypothetical protein